MKGLLIAVLMCVAASVQAKDHIVQAVPGAAQALISSGQVSGGDTIILQDGYHGRIAIKDQRFALTVTITSVKGARPRLDQLGVVNSSGWRITGLTIIPQRPENQIKTLVDVSQSSDVHLTQMTVASAAHSESWSAQQWRALAKNGVRLFGRNLSITNSYIKNTRHGINANADMAHVENNVVENFSGDGIRGLGDNSVYIANAIKTCIEVDDNHDDGFQSWSVDAVGNVGKGVVRNVRVERNVIENGNHPTGCTLQGIGLFGGFYEDWVIRDNTVIVDHWHGITVMGARSVLISGNVVVDSRPGKPGAPWIAITEHRDGRLSQNSVIKNNVTQTALRETGSKFVTTQPGVRRQGNVVVTNPNDALRRAKGRGARP